MFDLLIKQAVKYKPKMVFIADKDKTIVLNRALAKEKIIVLENQDELFESFYQDDLHLVLMAIVGFAGLLPSLEVIKAGKDLAMGK